MEKANRQLQARLEQLDVEIRRLRALNEKISLNGVAEGASPGQINVDARPLSPPPEAQSGVDQAHEDTSASPEDSGY